MSFRLFLFKNMKKKKLPSEVSQDLKKKQLIDWWLVIFCWRLFEARCGPLQFHLNK